MFPGTKTRNGYRYTFWHVSQEGGGGYMAKMVVNPLNLATVKTFPFVLSRFSQTSTLTTITTRHPARRTCEAGQPPSPQAPPINKQQSGGRRTAVAPYYYDRCSRTHERAYKEERTTVRWRTLLHTEGKSSLAKKQELLVRLSLISPAPAPTTGLTIM